jgi:hypothetical protein
MRQLFLCIGLFFFTLHQNWCGEFPVKAQYSVISHILSFACDNQQTITIAVASNSEEILKERINLLQTKAKLRTASSFASVHVFKITEIPPDTTVDAVYLCPDITIGDLPALKFKMSIATTEKQVQEGAVFGLIMQNYRPRIMINQKSLHIKKVPIPPSILELAKFK